MTTETKSRPGKTEQVVLVGLMRVMTRETVAIVNRLMLERRRGYILVALQTQGLARSTYQAGDIGAVRIMACQTTPLGNGLVYMRLAGLFFVALQTDLYRRLSHQFECLFILGVFCASHLFMAGGAISSGNRLMLVRTPEE